MYFFNQYTQIKQYILMLLKHGMQKLKMFAIGWRNL